MAQACAFLILPVTPARAGAVQTVALSGTMAPGTGSNFDSFSAPIINGNGQTAFGAYIDDLDGSGGLWSEGSGSLAKVALQGEAAPSTGLNFADPFNARLYLNDSGQTAFEQELSDFITVGAFSETGPGNSLRKIAAGGDSAPGTTDPLRVYRDFLGTLGGLNNSGQSAFEASMPPTGAGNPGNFPANGIWSEGSGTLDKVAETGDPAPGTVDQFDSFGIPAINNNGHVAFRGDTGPGLSTHEGIWTNRTGTLSRLVGEGDAAPGGGTFSILFGPTVNLNDTGDVAFSATLVGNADGVWVARGGGIDKVAVEGDIAPGAGGATFRTTGTGIESATIGLDSAGNTAFTSYLSNGERGLFSEGLGGLHAVAITGDVAPDTGGLTFDTIVHWAMNEMGQTAILAGLSDFTEAIFAEDILGQLQWIVGPGDLLEVAPGDFREVEFVNFFGLDGSIGSGGNNVSSGFSSSGSIAFQADFVDGSSGVFVTTVAVPEPGSFVLLTIGGLLLAVAVKRRR